MNRPGPEGSNRSPARPRWRGSRLEVCRGCPHRGAPVQPRVPPRYIHGETMRWWWSVVLFATAIVAMATFPQQPPQHCATVYALGYNGENGVSIPITACARPGSGRIFISADGILSSEFQEAVKTAEAVLTARYPATRNYDIYLTIGGPATILEGPSAGAAIYGAIFAAVNGYHPAKIAASGVLTPTGQINGVLYASKKAEAFNGTVILPQASCVRGAKCVENVGQLEELIASQSV